MLTLGISTSSKQPSAAVMRGGEIISFRRDDSGSSHSATLMGLIENALDDAGVKAKDLDAIAVDIGPGSFTGVRIGVSCANAMAFALGIKVIPVSSLAAMRRAVYGGGLVCCLLDARNGNGYAAVYRDGECVKEPYPCVVSELAAEFPPEEAAYIGDEKNLCAECAPEASLVLREARAVLAEKGEACLQNEAVPMYLRPSQAERTRAEK